MLKQWKDTLTDHWHYRYHQYYDGVRLERAKLSENAYEGFTYLLSGKMANTLETMEVFGTDPQIDEEIALETALEYLNYETYYCNNASYEQEIKHAMNDVNATYYPVES
jgi:hypothetical protein